MANKKITDLQLRGSVEDTLNFPVDDTIQTYRITVGMLKAFLLAASSITRTMLTPAERVPIGVVMPFAGSSAPTGYLLCDGSAVSRTTYSDLFAILASTHGQGDGSTTFNLPDYRGRFLRGVDSGQGRDTDAATRTTMATGGNTGDNVGSIQGHAFQTHTHIQNSHTHGFTSINAGSTFTGGYQTAATTQSQLTSAATAVNQDAAATGIHAQATANETRPVNAAVNYLIKF